VYHGVIPILLFFKGTISETLKIVVIQDKTQGAVHRAKTPNFNSVENLNSVKDGTKRKAKNKNIGKNKEKQEIKVKK